MNNGTKANSDDSCLLTYFAATNPQPIQVSTPDTPVTGIVNTAALNPEAKPLYCNRIVIAVPVDAEGLFAASPTPSASVNTGKWAISTMAIRRGSDLGFSRDISYSTFTFECRDPSDYQINYNLVFGLLGQVTDTPDDYTIWIQEHSGTTSDPNTFTDKTTSYTVTTYTPQFYLQNLMTTVPTAPTVPATEFANGADIRFSWESNGTYFQIYQKGSTTPIYSGTQTSYTLTRGVATDTTFVLVAMMSGNPSGDQPSGGYAPIYLYDVLSITISNPDLTPRTAAISGNASVGGNLGVTGSTSLSNASVGGTLGVSGNTSLGNASVGGALGVSGQTNLANAIVGGQLTANGRVGVGTNTPGYPLSFPDTLGDKITLWGQSDWHYGFGIQPALLQIHTDTNQADVAFGHGSSGAFTETMRVKGNGNVGIGTASPGAKLEVDGDVKVTGSLTIGDWTLECRHDGAWGSDRSALFIRYQGTDIVRLGPTVDMLQIYPIDGNLNRHGYFYFNAAGNSGYIG